MLLRRDPPPLLAPFVERLWIGAETVPRVARERALPTGCASLAVRLTDDPVRVFADENDREGASHGLAVVGGMRARYHVRDTSRPARSVGVHFRPLGAALLLGVPAHELAGRHTALEDLWGVHAAELRERLLEARDPSAVFATVEEILVRRISRAALPPPAIRAAVARLEARPDTPIEALRAAANLSHRRFVELFRRSVGLTPKELARVLRFQRALRRASAAGPRRWAEVALAAGYCDQPHLNREFRVLAGITPGSWTPVDPRRPNHVPVA